MKFGQRNKYNATRASYNGVMYDSALERNMAIVLDDHLKSGRLKSVNRQHKIDLVVNGYRVTTHIVDFLVELPDGRFKFIESKGFPTELWRFKMKLTVALNPGIEYLVNPTDRQIFL